MSYEMVTLLWVSLRYVTKHVRHGWFIDFNSWLYITPRPDAIWKNGKLTYLHPDINIIITAFHQCLFALLNLWVNILYMR